MQELLDLLEKTSPVLLSAFSFLVGLILGHRIALYRDKRKEFNAAIEPLRESLLKFQRMPDASRLDYLSQYLGKRKTARLAAAIERYYQCAREETEQDRTTGEIIYRNPEALKQAAAEVAKHLEFWD